MITTKCRELIEEYWSRKVDYTILDMRRLPESDLLFLIPNNVKRRYGLPLTRIDGGKKKQQKQKRKQRIIRDRMFLIIEDSIDNYISHLWPGDFFEQFVDIKHIGEEEPYVFVKPDLPTHYLYNKYRVLKPELKGKHNND